MRKKIIRLKIKEVMKAAVDKEISTDTQLAAAIGVSVTQIWRAKLAFDDPRHNAPGVNFIAGVLNTFEGKFEDYFFLDETIRMRIT